MGSHKERREREKERKEREGGKTENEEVRETESEGERGREQGWALSVFFYFFNKRLFLEFFIKLI